MYSELLCPQMFSYAPPNELGNGTSSCTVRNYKQNFLIAWSFGLKNCKYKRFIFFSSPSTSPTIWPNVIHCWAMYRRDSIARLLHRHAIDCACIPSPWRISSYCVEPVSLQKFRLICIFHNIPSKIFGAECLQYFSADSEKLKTLCHCQ